MRLCQIDVGRRVDIFRQVENPEAREKPAVGEETFVVSVLPEIVGLLALIIQVLWVIRNGLVSDFVNYKLTGFRKVCAKLLEQMYRYGCRKDRVILYGVRQISMRPLGWKQSHCIVCRSVRLHVGNCPDKRVSRDVILVHANWRGRAIG